MGHVTTTSFRIHIPARINMLLKETAQQINCNCSIFYDHEHVTLWILIPEPPSNHMFKSKKLADDVVNEAERDKQ